MKNFKAFISKHKNINSLTFQDSASIKMSIRFRIFKVEHNIEHNIFYFEFSCFISSLQFPKSIKVKSSFFPVIYFLSRGI